MDILQFVLQNLGIIRLVVFLLLFAVGLIWVYISSHETSGLRGVKTYLGHVLLIILGWRLGGLTGFILISLPILIFYYYLSFHLAMVVVPVSDPDNLQEWWKRFLVFVRYQWGLQYPHWIVTDTFGQNIETRIPGDQFGSFAPGLVLARSHQVVGLTTGMTFSRVPDPGNVFTGRYESPLAVVDLRTQLRLAWIETISSDGIPFRALVFTAFRVDKEKWDRDLYHNLVRQNPLLENAQKLDFTKGSYSFSRARVRALFGTTGVSTHVHEHEEARVAKWDERALYQIQKTAREVLSQRRLDELWQPMEDREGANAMDEIAAKIKESCSGELRQRGIMLHATRIINLEFPETEVHRQGGDEIVGNAETNLIQGKFQEDQIEQKQIYAWSADWQREATQTRADGKAHADLLMQEARAYAYTNLLTAFAEGLEEARLLDPQLPRYVIAMRFIGALEKVVGQQPDVQGQGDVRNSLDQLKKMIPWATDGD